MKKKKKIQSWSVLCNPVMMEHASPIGFAVKHETAMTEQQDKRKHVLISQRLHIHTHKKSINIKSYFSQHKTPPKKLN